MVLTVHSPRRIINEKRRDRACDKTSLPFLIILWETPLETKDHQDVKQNLHCQMDQKPPRTEESHPQQLTPQLGHQGSAITIKISLFEEQSALDYKLSFWVVKPGKAREFWRFDAVILPILSCEGISTSIIFVHPRLN